jgi:hypothetical protein
MERVTGIGGVFLRASDPQALAEWYRANLGIPLDEGASYGTLVSAGAER